MDEKIKRNKLAVYTALFGDYDNLIDPVEKFEGCDFICFTDQKGLKSDVWEIRYVERCDLSPSIMNRKYKILVHNYLNEYNSSLYVDSNIKILKNPLFLSRKYLNKYDIVIPKHFKRECIYEEAKELAKLNKVDKLLLKKQINFYKKEGFPKKYGLGENNVIFRNHTEKVIFLMEKWWEMLTNYTQRDQLSLMYLIWKYDFDRLFLMRESARGGEYFKLKLHKQNFRKGLIGELLNFKNEYLINNPNSLFYTLNQCVSKLIKKA